MRLNKIFVIILLLFLFPKVNGQEHLSLEDKEYLFPIKVGNVVQLSGNMGELRKAHFHSGIDIKTKGKTGFPLISTMEGCVSRVKITHKGYGKALYIFDKNGFTNVYAHLKNFYNELEQQTINFQYQNESYTIDFKPKKCMSFPVEKGKILGLSGNSGGSSGPHLHFEIRDNEQCPVDPLEFNLKLIKDTKSPIIKKIGFIPMDIQSFVNGNHSFTGPFNLTHTKNINKYILKNKVQAIGTIGISLLVDDYHNGSYSRLGVKDIKLYDNDSLLLHQVINTFCFHQTRKILLFYEYEQYIKTNKKFYSLYKKTGNDLKFYKTLKNDGKIKINDGETHSIKIVAEDTFGNSSELKFKIFGKTKNEVKPSTKNNKNDKIYLKNDYLIIEEKKNVKNVESTLFIKGEKSNLFDVCNLEYKTFFYLPWNQTSKSFGDSLQTENKTYKLKKYIKLSPKFNTHHNMLYKIEEDGQVEYTIIANKKAVVTPTYLEHNYQSKKKTLQIGTSLDVFYKPLTIFLCLEGKNAVDSKVGIYKVEKDKHEFISNKIADGGLKFSIREGGLYKIRIDTIPPIIKPLVVSKKSLRFMVEDVDSGIKSYRCTFDNNWLLLEYDYKTKILKSNGKDTHFPLQKGNLQLLIVDNVGNEKIYSKDL